MPRSVSSESNEDSLSELGIRRSSRLAQSSQTPSKVTTRRTSSSSDVQKSPSLPKVKTRRTSTSSIEASGTPKGRSRRLSSVTEDLDKPDDVHAANLRRSTRLSTKLDTPDINTPSKVLTRRASTNDVSTPSRLTKSKSKTNESDSDDLYAKARNAARRCVSESPTKDRSSVVRLTNVVNVEEHISTPRGRSRRSVSKSPTVPPKIPKTKRKLDAVSEEPPEIAEEKTPTEQLSPKPDKEQFEETFNQSPKSSMLIKDSKKDGHISEVSKSPLNEKENLDDGIITEDSPNKRVHYKKRVLSEMSIDEVIKKDTENAPVSKIPLEGTNLVKSSTSLKTTKSNIKSTDTVDPTEELKLSCESNVSKYICEQEKKVLLQKKLDSPQCIASHSNIAQQNLSITIMRDLSIESNISRLSISKSELSEKDSQVAEDMVESLFDCELNDVAVNEATEKINLPRNLKKTENEISKHGPNVSKDTAGCETIEQLTELLEGDENIIKSGENLAKEMEAASTIQIEVKLSNTEDDSSDSDFKLSIDEDRAKVTSEKNEIDIVADAHEKHTSKADTPKILVSPDHTFSFQVHKEGLLEGGTGEGTKTSQGSPLSFVENHFTRPLEETDLESDIKRKVTLIDKDQIKVLDSIEASTSKTADVSSKISEHEVDNNIVSEISSKSKLPEDKVDEKEVTLDNEDLDKQNTQQTSKTVQSPILNDEDSIEASISETANVSSEIFEHEVDNNIVSEKSSKSKLHEDKVDKKEVTLDEDSDNQNTQQTPRTPQSPVLNDEFGELLTRRRLKEKRKSEPLQISTVDKSFGKSSPTKRGRTSIPSLKLGECEPYRYKKDDSDEEHCSAEAKEQQISKSDFSSDEKLDTSRVLNLEVVSKEKEIPNEEIIESSQEVESENVKEKQSEITKVNHNQENDLTSKCLNNEQLDNTDYSLKEMPEYQNQKSEEIISVQYGKDESKQTTQERNYSSSLKSSKSQAAKCQDTENVSLPNALQEKNHKLESVKEKCKSKKLSPCPKDTNIPLESQSKVFDPSADLVETSHTKSSLEKQKCQEKLTDEFPVEELVQQNENVESLISVEKSKLLSKKVKKHSISELNRSEADQSECAGEITIASDATKKQKIEKISHSDAQTEARSEELGLEEFSEQNLESGNPKKNKGRKNYDREEYNESKIQEIIESTDEEKLKLRSKRMINHTGDSEIDEKAQPQESANISVSSDKGPMPESKKKKHKTKKHSLSSDVNTEIIEQNEETIQTSFIKKDLELKYSRKKQKEQQIEVQGKLENQNEEFKNEMLNSKEQPKVHSKKEKKHSMSLKCIEPEVDSTQESDMSSKNQKSNKKGSLGEFAEVKMDNNSAPISENSATKGSSKKQKKKKMGLNCSADMTYKMELETQETITSNKDLDKTDKNTRLNTGDNQENPVILEAGMSRDPFKRESSEKNQRKFNKSMMNSPRNPSLPEELGNATNILVSESTSDNLTDYDASPTKNIKRKRISSLTKSTISDEKIDADEELSESLSDKTLDRSKLRNETQNKKALNLSKEIEKKIDDAIKKCMSSEDQIEEENVSSELEEGDDRVSCDGEESNEEGDSSVFIYDMAEEGYEDTPSENSNDIPVHGENIEDAFEVISDLDESYEKNSFIDDDEDYQLLSGSEYETSASEMEKSSESEVKSDSERKWTRIITISESSESNESDVFEVEQQSDNEGKAASKKSSDDDHFEEVNEKTISVEAIIIDDLKSASDEDLKEVEIFSSENEETKMVDEEMIPDKKNKLDSRFPRSKKTSLTLQENVSVDDIKNASLSERINSIVNIFCSDKDSEGEVSLNISLDYSPKAATDVSKSSKFVKTSDRKVEQLTRKRKSLPTEKLDNESFSKPPDNVIEFNKLEQNKSGKKQKQKEKPLEFSSDIPSGSKDTEKLVSDASLLSDFKGSPKTKKVKQAECQQSQYITDQNNKVSSKAKKKKIKSDASLNITHNEVESASLSKSNKVSKHTKRKHSEIEVQETFCDVSQVPDNRESELVTSPVNKNKKIKIIQNIIFKNEDKGVENVTDSEGADVLSKKKKRYNKRKHTKKVTSSEEDTSSVDFKPVKLGFSRENVKQFKSEQVPEHLPQSHNKSCKKRKRDFKEENFKQSVATTTSTYNRNRRLIYASVNNKDVGSMWKTEIINLNPSKRSNKPVQHSFDRSSEDEFDPKDIRNRRMFDNKRVKRMDTKKLLMKQGRY